MTKQELEAKLSEFMDYYVSSHFEYNDNSFETIKHRMYSLLSQYDDKITLKDNMINKLEKIQSKQYFDICKALYMEFLKFINTDYDLSGIKYKPKYVLSFAQLNETIKIAERDKIWGQLDSKVQAETANRFVMAKLFAYLLWVGLDHNMIYELKRADYDLSNKVINVCDNQFDLDSIFYQEDNQSNIISDELIANILSKETVNINGFIDYDTRYINSGYPKCGKIRESCSEKVIRSSSGGSKNLNLKVGRAVNLCFYNTNIIYKSGVLYRLFLAEKVYNTHINNDTLPDLLRQFNCSYTSYDNLLAEYKNIYRKLKEL